MKINGKEKKLEVPISLLELLKLEGFQTERIAVELNGEILPKSLYDATVLKESDKIEVVSFVGGG
ncbi:MAG: sulfur carrier protein ThiS [Lachnospiraceae bacterium]|nr:sulfur carrier protein ThiS [Lachnospiraceae bacterium]